MRASYESRSRSVSVFNRRAFVRTAGAGLGALALPGALSACSGAAEDDGPAGIEDVPQVQLGEETEGIQYPDPYVGPRASKKEPFHDGSKTFRIVVPQDAQVVGDWAKNEMTKWLEERTGVKVEYEAVLVTNTDGTVDMTKINAMLASGDLPDAFLDMPFTDDQISLYGQQGVFAQLDDYIETYAPEMRRIYEEYPDWSALTAATDGNHYQFRGINDCYHCRVGNARAFVNKKYVDKVGGAIPTTTDEMRELLKLFKEKDPSGTGKMIPFTGGVNMPIDRFIMNAFLYNPGGDNNTGWMWLQDGKVDFVANKPEWREGLRYLRTLFDDGTMSREAFTLTNDAYLRAGNQGRIGIARAYWWGQFADISYEDGALWRDYVAVPPLKGPNGVQYTAWEHYNYGHTRFVITSACSNPEILMQWADSQLELEAIMMAYAGNPETNWSWAKDGDTSLTGGPAVFKIKEWPAPEGQGWSQHSVMYRSNDFRLGQYSDPDNPDFEQGLYEVSTEYEPFAEPKEFQLPPLIFDESGAAQKAETAAAIEKHVEQHLAKFAVGELNIDDDAAWNGYVSAFDGMGLQSYLQLHQEAYENRPQ